jgi:hypothetical protein
VSISAAIGAIESRAAGVSCATHFSGEIIKKPNPPEPFALVEVEIGTGAGVTIGTPTLVRYEGRIDVTLYAYHDARAALLTLVDEVVGMFPSGLTLDGTGVKFLGKGMTIGRVEISDGDDCWLVCEISARFMVDQ